MWSKSNHIAAFALDLRNIPKTQFLKNIFNLQLTKSTNTETLDTDMEAQLYLKPMISHW
jgi:hypothetical protein